MLGGTIEKIDMNQYKKVRERGGSLLKECLSCLGVFSPKKKDFKRLLLSKR